MSKRDHGNERGPRPTFATCGNCGGYPLGIGCYHICYNSVHYYSPEQERADDPLYGLDDQRERYAATTDPAQYVVYDDEPEPDFESLVEARAERHRPDWADRDDPNDNDLPF